MGRAVRDTVENEVSEDSPETGNHFRSFDIKRNYVFVLVLLCQAILLRW